MNQFLTGLNQKYFQLVFQEGMRKIVFHFSIERNPKVIELAKNTLKRKTMEGFFAVFVILIFLVFTVREEVTLSKVITLDRWLK